MQPRITTNTDMFHAVLVPHSGNKDKWCLHYRNLQLYLYLGMKWVNVNRVSKFKQSDWLKKYLDFNTDKRKNVTNSFEKDFFKLMNNSVYCKSMQNLRKRIKLRLVHNIKEYKKYVSKPSFVSYKIFNKNFVAIHEIESVLMLVKPIYVGFSILDLSKLLMHEFHYKYIGRKYYKKVKLLFTCTGSLVYKIETNDVYEEFYKNKNLLTLMIVEKIQDFWESDWWMKDEVKGKIISGFVELNSKM